MLRFTPEEFANQEALYIGQLHIMKTYLSTQLFSAQNNEQNMILSALQNVIKKIEAVYHHQNQNAQNGWVNPDLSRSAYLEETFRQLNQVLENIRLIYLPLDYGVDFSFDLYEHENVLVNKYLNAVTAANRRLSHNDNNLSVTDKICKLKALINQLPGATNQSDRNLAIALLLLTLLSVSLLILITTPSILGIAAAKHILEIILLSITGFASFSGFTFFSTRLLKTPNLAQAVQELPPPQMRL